MTTILVHRERHKTPQFNSQPVPHSARPYVSILPRPSRIRQPTLSLQVQATYPNRVLVTVTNLTAGQLVRVTRTPAGSTTRTAVRGLDNVTATSDAIISADAEVPFGVAVTYTLTVDEFDGQTATLTLSLTNVALSDAISGDAAEVIILAWPEKRTERNSSVYSVGGRNIVVSGQAGGFTSTIDVFVETDDSKNNVLNLLRNATSGILQVRSDQSLTSDGVDCYVVATSWVEQRYSQDGSDERRIISLEVVESSTWGPTLASSTFTLQSIANHYPNGTLADIRDDFTGQGLLGIAMGDFS